MLVYGTSAESMDAEIDFRIVQHLFNRILIKAGYPTSDKVIDMEFGKDEVNVITSALLDNSIYARHNKDTLEQLIVTTSLFSSEVAAGIRNDNLEKLAA
jgi:hypothetical protein